MNKNFKIITLIVLLSFLILPEIVSAANIPFWGPIVPCGTSTTPKCTLCHVFELGQNIINLLLTLILVAAPVFIIIGAIFMLTSGGMPEKATQGKKVITFAIIGLLIAFGSWLIINQILVKLAGTKATEGEGPWPWPWNKIECTPTEVSETHSECVEEICKEVEGAGNNECQTNEECEEQIPWCQREAPLGSSTWVLTPPPVGAYPQQKGDASPELASFLNCMYLSIHDLQINSISSNILCNDPTCDTSTGNCGHTANSCHYGGRYCTGLSRAVDFHATAETCSEIKEAALKCDSTAWANWEFNHLHISVQRAGCGCNEREIPRSCP